MIPSRHRSEVPGRRSPAAYLLMALAVLIPCTVWASEAGHGGAMGERITHLMIQLAVILVVANVAGFLCRRYLDMPSVLGEVASGIIIGPFALGHLQLPVIGALFPNDGSLMPIAPELYGIAVLASILLLFMSGLETDVAMFLKYSVKGTIVGIGGIVFAFGLGAYSAFWFGLADEWHDPAALFLGAISTATSVGITARILSEKRKMDSPEGVTILAAAVLDDVLCIIILAMVTGIAKVELAGGDILWGDIGWIALKAFGFWVILTSVGLLTAKRIARFVKAVRSPATISHISLGIALLLAGVSEMAGLAMIIGAYITGLALSRTDLVDVLQNQLHSVYQVLVPVFFCVMGMMVDLSAMRGVILFGLVYSLLAIFAKVAGCGLAGYISRFNLRGSLRIGFGMLPRGEVALIVAGVGLASGAISSNIFGAAIMMTMITTVMAPPVLNHLLDGGRGVRGEAREAAEKTSVIALDFPSYDIAEFLLSHLVKAFRNEEFFVFRLPVDQLSYRIRKDDLSFTLTQDGPRIELTVLAEGDDIARYILLEELLTLQDLFQASSKLRGLDQMGADLITGGEAAADSEKSTS